MESIEERIAAFLANHKLKVAERIGFGIHGQVFSVFQAPLPALTVVKFFEDQAPFYRERNVYRRLAEEAVIDLVGCKIPTMLGCDEDCLAIRMEIVTRPFCLDFAAAYLDDLPGYFPPFDAEWHASKEEQFGADDWRKAQEVLAELEALGIYQTDPSPTNISV